ncbi:MAG: prephenate dehydrogenase [Brevinematales bacterium]|nr:prephenate dehydrogenase [Brevinematales bacterium]
MFKNIAIAGLGLIGGSIGSAIKSASPNTAIIGITRNTARIKQLPQSKYFDTITDYHNLEVIKNSDLCIICTNVSSIPDTFKILKPHLNPDTLISDVGSVKKWIVETINDNTFIGSHPMAGSEKSGIENSDPNIFKNSICVITPLNNTQEQIEKITNFWQSIGMKTIILSPDKHDKIVSETSHFVHLIAFLISSTLSFSEFSEKLFYNIFGKGLLDTTRISKSDPTLWIEIFQKNSENLTETIERFIKLLEETKNHITNNNWDKLQETLQKAKEFREKLG